MSLPEQISAYLQPRFVISDAALSVALVKAGQQRLTHTKGITAAQYSIANCLSSKVLDVTGQTLGSGLPWLEFPELSRLASFYEEHGLETLTTDELVATQAAEKLRSAWALLVSVPDTGACVQTLVKTIQVLRSPDSEIDVSYSHPAIQFSVFVSVGEDTSRISSLRVAESLLHEAMHLKLTLLEEVVTLINPSSAAQYFSPWRDELRPVRGVLHGLFVFRAVHDFYLALSQSGVSRDIKTFLTHRIEDISAEISLLQGFSEIPDLTKYGRQLASNLLECGASAGNH